MTDETKLSEFLSLLNNVEDHSGYWTAQCPAHDDRANSLSVSRGDKADVVLKCHAGCKIPAIMHNLGRTVSWLFPDHGRSGSNKSSGPKGTLVASFDYCDEDSVVLRQSCRYEREVDGETVKTFSQRRPNGKGGWINGTKGVRNVPYRLPELLKSHKSEMVLVVEGEKHVDRLRDLGFVATCNVGGAGKWLKEFKKYFVGRDVVILPDNDTPGQNHAADVAEKLKDSANSIRCVELPNLPQKGDVIDWLVAGGTAEQLRALIDAQLPGVPEKLPEKKVTPEDDRKLCKELGLFVYGEDDRGQVKVFSEFHRKSQFIRDVNRLTFADLLRVCGPVTREFVYTGNEDTPEGMYKIKAVRDAIAMTAGFRPVTEDSEIGVGVWEGAEDSSQPPAIVLVNSRESSVLNGRSVLQRHAAPKFGDLFLDMGASSPWFDHEEIDKYLRSYTTEWSTDVVQQADAVFSKWRFPTSHQEVMPSILTGLVMASWVQTVWKWRPQVFIYGKSASGKSTIFETLSGNEARSTFGLFGKLAFASGDVSAAGIAQALASTARIAVLDELERSPHRSAIMQMLRNSGGGSRKVRGSTHHKAVEFQLRHLVWAAATETGLKQEPDTNRFIAIELLKPPDDEMGELQIPPDEELQRLGCKLLAIAVKTVQAARSLVERLKSKKPVGYHARVVETYAVPAASYAMACGMGDDEAAEIHARMLMTHDVDSIEADEKRLVGAIMESIVSMKPGERCTVAQAIERVDFGQHYHELESYGIGVMKEPDKSLGKREKWIEGEEICVFLSPTAITTHLLRSDEWTDANLTQILSRVPKSIRCRKRIAARQVRGVLIPLDEAIQSSGDTF